MLFELAVERMLRTVAFVGYLFEIDCLADFALPVARPYSLVLMPKMLVCQMKAVGIVFEMRVVVVVAVVEILSLLNSLMRGC